MTNQLIYGLVTGVLFGFFLQRGQVLRYDKQIGALRLMDMTILKFMLTAIFVGCVGIYLLKDLGLVNLSIKSTVLGATMRFSMKLQLKLAKYSDNRVQIPGNLWPGYPGVFSAC
jgi:Na+/H+-dicarboxylate symporter